MTAKEIIDKCTVLKIQAICLDNNFNESNYEWELGTKIIQELQAENKANFMGECIITQLLGIQVRLNRVDYNRIKLWKEIKT